MAKTRDLAKEAFDFLPPRLKMLIQYYRVHRRLPDLRQPRRFTEKVQIRKLYNRDPRFAAYSDKIDVKEHVKALLGADWVIPTLYFGEDLPPPSKRIWPIPYVIKAAHGSSWNYFVQAEPDWPAIEKEVRYWLTHSYGTRLGEWHYTQMQKRILIEPFIGASLSPADYKLYVFSGRVHCIQVVERRFVDHHQSIYSRDWVDLGVFQGFPQISPPASRPACLDEMIEAAELLGREFSFVRVDLYEVDGRPKFGELTFLHQSGLMAFTPDSFDYELGALWHEPY